MICKSQRIKKHSRCKFYANISGCFHTQSLCALVGFTWWVGERVSFYRWLSLLFTQNNSSQPKRIAANHTRMFTPLLGQLVRQEQGKLRPVSSPAHWSWIEFRSPSHQRVFVWAQEERPPLWAGIGAIVLAPECDFLFSHLLKRIVTRWKINQGSVDRTKRLRSESRLRACWARGG